MHSKSHFGAFQHFLPLTYASNTFLFYFFKYYLTTFSSVSYLESSTLRALVENGRGAAIHRLCLRGTIARPVLIELLRHCCNLKALVLNEVDSASDEVRVVCYMCAPTCLFSTFLFLGCALKHASPVLCTQPQAHFSLFLGALYIHVILMFLCLPLNHRFFLSARRRWHH